MKFINSTFPSINGLSFLSVLPATCLWGRNYFLSLFLLHTVPKGYHFISTPQLLSRVIIYKYNCHSSPFSSLTALSPLLMTNFLPQTGSLGLHVYYLWELLLYCLVISQERYAFILCLFLSV